VAALSRSEADGVSETKMANSTAKGFHGRLDGHTPCIDRSTAGSGADLSAALAEYRVKTGKVERKSVADEIRTTGSVAVDERRLAYVQVRFSGYIQKVFADATYQYVRKGSLYSQFTARS